MFKFSAEAEAISTDINVDSISISNENMMDVEGFESDFEEVAEDAPFAKTVNAFLNKKAWNKELADGDGGSTNAILRCASALEVY